jgi:hypothetical protein
MKRYAILSAILLVGLLVGCEKEEVVPDEPPPPPPPTAQELHRNAVQGTKLNAPLPEFGSGLGPKKSKAWLEKAQQQRNQLAGELNGQEAMRLVSVDIVKRARAVADLEAWLHVLLMFDAQKIFDPGSDSLDRLREKSIRELKKPIVTYLTLYERDGVYTLQVNMFVRLTRETFKKVTMAVNDIEHGVKFVSVIGRQQGALMEYVDGGKQFEIRNTPTL